jgi:hypothetical protein
LIKAVNWICCFELLPGVRREEKIYVGHVEVLAEETADLDFATKGVVT